MHTRISSILLVVLLFACPAWAVSVSGVSGTVSDGESITISGSDFGATGPIVQLYDDFEKGTNGNIISTSADSATVDEWDYVESAPVNPKYSTAYAHSGTKSMLSDQATSEMGRWAIAEFTGTSYVYYSYWVYLPVGCDVPGTDDPSGPNWKFSDVSGGDIVSANYQSDICNFVLMGDLPNPLSVAFIGCWHDCSGLDEGVYGSTTMTKGQWHRIETYQAGGISNNGTLYLAQMNASNARTVSRNATNVNTLQSGDSWVQFRLHSFARQETNGQCYYDDVYLATGTGARARVEIGNNATYTSCTNLTVCTPTSWSDTSITATVRGGSFTSGTAYLFVTDASGVTSAGKEITFGSGSSPSTPTITGVMTGSIR